MINISKENKDEGMVNIDRILYGKLLEWNGIRNIHGQLNVLCGLLPNDKTDNVEYILYRACCGGVAVSASHQINRMEI